MLKKKRIAVVVSHPIQYFAPLYRRLANEPDLDLHVLFASRFGLDATYDRQMNVTFAWATDLTGGYSHSFLPNSDRISEIGFTQINNPGVGKALAAHNPDSVVIHGYASLTVLRALVWCRVHRVPAMMILDSSTASSKSWLRRQLKTYIVPFILNQFSALLTMSERSEVYLEGFGYPRARMFRTPTMIDDRFWRAREQRQSIRARTRLELGLAAHEIVLLYSGKLIAIKRVSDLLQSLVKLDQAGGLTRNITLLIAGDGEERSELEAFAVQHQLPVRFLGFQNIDILPDIYCASDILVHAGELENFGMVVAEAAVIGLPLILSDRIGAIGPTSIARPDENTLVYPCRDIDALCTAIVRLSSDPELRQRMGVASLDVSLDHSGAVAVQNIRRALDNVSPTGLRARTATSVVG